MSPIFFSFLSGLSFFFSFLSRLPTVLITLLFCRLLLFIYLFIFFLSLSPNLQAVSKTFPLCQFLFPSLKPPLPPFLLFFQNFPSFSSFRETPFLHPDFCNLSLFLLLLRLLTRLPFPTAPFLWKTPLNLPSLHKAPLFPCLIFPYWFFPQLHFSMWPFWFPMVKPELPWYSSLFTRLNLVAFLLHFWEL